MSEDDEWGHDDLDPDDEQARDDAPRLGPCCHCGKEGPDVRTIVTLPKTSPIGGRGWGCALCGLPADGASYVLCDACFDRKREPLFACRGYPGQDGRVPISDLVGTHEHDEAKHAADDAGQLWLDDGEEEEEREPAYPDDYFRCSRCGTMAEGPALMLWPDDHSFLWEVCNDCFARLTGQRVTYPAYQRKRDDPNVLAPQD